MAWNALSTGLFSSYTQEASIFSILLGVRFVCDVLRFGELFTFFYPFNNFTFFAWQKVEKNAKANALSSKAFFPVIEVHVKKQKGSLFYCSPTHVQY